MRGRRMLLIWKRKENTIVAIGEEGGHNCCYGRGRWT